MRKIFTLYQYKLCIFSNVKKIFVKLNNKKIIHILNILQKCSFQSRVKSINYSHLTFLKELVTKNKKWEIFWLQYISHYVAKNIHIIPHVRQSCTKKNSIFISMLQRLCDFQHFIYNSRILTRDYLSVKWNYARCRHEIINAILTNSQGSQRVIAEAKSAEKRREREKHTFRLGKGNVRILHYYSGYR